MRPAVVEKRNRASPTFIRVRYFNDEMEYPKDVADTGRGSRISTLTTVRCESHRSTASNAMVRGEFEALLAESSDEEEEEKEEEERRSDESGKSSSRPRCQASATGNERLGVAIFEDTDEIILSLIWHNGHLGAAYYNIVTSELFVMEDTMEDIERFDTIKILYRQCLPRYVLIHATAPIAFTTAVKKAIMSDATSADSTSVRSVGSVRNAMLKVACKKECSYERCAHRVRCLRLEHEPRCASTADRLTFLNSILNFKCCAMIHALGALLLFVDKHWNEIALNPTGRPFFVTINYIALQDLVTVDEEAYNALNIVQIKDHPSLFKLGKTTANGKGTSLYSLLNRYCLSTPGAHFLWNALHHPTQNLAVLEQRFDAIAYFLDPNNQSIVENLSTCLRQVYRLTTTILLCCSGPRAKASNWYKLHKTISNVICIGDICQEHATKLHLFKRIAESITVEMRYVKYFVEYIVDFGESRREGRLMIKPNVDPLLDELNHVRRNLPELLTRMAQKDMRERLPPSAAGCNMVYLPNIGYVLAINQWNPTPPEKMSFPDLEFKFSINQVHYYKSPAAKAKTFLGNTDARGAINVPELDETVGDVILKISVRQNHILQKLIRYIKKQIGAIQQTIHLCGQLDTLLAFYKVARDYNYARPALTKGKVIDVKESRHPLIECSTSFVPNDIRSGDGSSLIKVLTGPNSCGKSVYLKQIGLVVFMAHIGSYVPATSARIGTISRISTQMSSTESVGLNASSFLLNLRQINVAVRASTSNSLVITDELDRGTSEISGVSLVAAVLNTFAETGNDCPHVFAATHAYRVLALLHQTPLIGIQTFEHTVNQDDSLAFLYRLTNGSTARSYAHHVARMAELNEDVVVRSLEVYDNMKQRKLPSPLHSRSASIKRIVDRFKQDRTVDFDELKTLVRQIVHRKP